MQVSDNAKGAALMVAAMTTYATNDALIKFVFQAMPMSQAVVLRGLVATALMGLLIVRSGGLRLRFSRRDRALVLMRIGAELGLTIFFLRALAAMPLANLHAVMQMLPLTVALAAALFLREPLGWRRLSAILVGFAGVMLIIRPGTSGFDAQTLNGLAAVGFITLRDLIARRFSADVPSLSVAFLTAGAVTLWFAVAGLGEAWVPVAPGAALLLAGAAVMILMGYVFSVMTMRVGEIGFVSPFRYSGLLAALVLGWALFGDWPDSLTFAGAGIVVATGLFTLYRERQLAARTAAAPRAARPAA
jgi:drug/metabolite transporter (DMT)-like permease